MSAESDRDDWETKARRRKRKLDAALVEVARLTRERDEALQDRDFVQGGLNQCVDECNALRVEVARLRADRAQFVDDMAEGWPTLSATTKERDSLRAEVERLTKEGDFEREQANEWLVQLQDMTKERDEARADLRAYVNDTAVTCAYCGARKDRPVTFEDIKAHIGECPKHPMAALRARVEQLEGAGSTLLKFLPGVEGGPNRFSEHAMAIREFRAALAPEVKP